MATKTASKKTAPKKSVSKFPCPECDRIFGTQGGLKIHQTRAHGPAKAKELITPESIYAEVELAEDQVQVVQEVPMAMNGVARCPVQIRVEFLDGSTHVFVPEEGWHVAPHRNVLIIGHDVPRVELPLINVRLYQIEPRD
jgi:hypothetical protein